VNTIEEAGPPVFYKFIIWATGLVLAPILFISDFMQLSGLKLTHANQMIGRDFFNVWTGGKLAAAGRLDILYDYKKYIAWQNHLVGPIGDYNYSYPPQSLFIAIPFSSIPYVLSLLLWTCLGGLFFFLASRSFVPKNMPPILTILTPAAMVNVWCGHYGFLIGGLWLLFFASIERHAIRSGIFASLLTLKPHLGFLIAVVLVIRKNILAICMAISFTIILVVMSGICFGFDLWRQWVFDTSALQLKIMTAPGQKFYYLMMPSTFIALRTAPREIAILAQVFVSALAIGFFWKARNANIKELAFISSSTTAIISPYIFNYDLTVASLGFAIFMHSKWNRLKLWERLVLFLAFLTPLLVMVRWFIAPIVLILGLLVQVRCADSRELVVSNNMQPDTLKLYDDKSGAAAAVQT
jgi:hypothetical protein